MQPFITVQGAAAPLLQPNIDTDVIIRIERLVGLPKDALGAFALEALRLQPDGSQDPACTLNWPQFREAPILLAGANFGCGSSREGAVWALLAMGIRCVIAPSFGDIFFNNSFQNGLLPIVLSAEQVTALSELTRTGQALTVDLKKCVIVGPDASVWPFPIEPARRESLLEGLDDIGLTLKHAEAIAAWERTDVQARPWIHLSKEEKI